MWLLNRGVVAWEWRLRGAGVGAGDFRNIVNCTGMDLSDD